MLQKQRNKILFSVIIKIKLQDRRLSVTFCEGNKTKSGLVSDLEDGRGSRDMLLGSFWRGKEKRGHALRGTPDMEGERGYVFRELLETEGEPGIYLWELRVTAEEPIHATGRFRI